MSIVVMVDSGICVSKEIAKRKDVCIVPLNFEFDHLKMKKDLVEIKDKGTLDSFVSDSMCLPLVHRPDKCEVEKQIREYIDNGDDIIYITISSKLSNHYQDILDISDKLNSSNLIVIDSMNLGPGQTLLVNLALDCIDKGYGIKKITKILIEAKDKIKSCYLTDDFVSFCAQDTSDELKLKYLEYYDKYLVLETFNGNTDVTFTSSSVEASYLIVETSLIDKIEEMNGNAEIVMVYLNAKDKALQLKRRILKKYPDVNIVLTESNTLLSMCTKNEAIGYSIVESNLTE